MNQRIIGLIGLGAVGFKLAQSLQTRGVKTLCFDFTDTNRLRSANAGIATTSSVSGVVMHLSARKIICLVLENNTEIEEATTLLTSLLNENDIIINAGEAAFAAQKKHHKALIVKGVHFLRGEIVNGSIQVNAMGDATLIPDEALNCCKFIFG